MMMIYHAAQNPPFTDERNHNLNSELTHTRGVCRGVLAGTGAVDSPAALVPVNCKCGRGKASRYDGKCGYCRSRKQQKTHLFKLARGLYEGAKS
jgi:hypothetical protein